MTPEELQFLYKQWVDGTQKASPAIETMTDKDIEELVAEVKKNGDSTLIQLSRSQLCRVVLSLLPTDG